MTQEKKGTSKGRSRPRAKVAAKSAAKEASGKGPVLVSPPTRLDMIAEAAYFRAEARHFEPGHDLEDWVEAEREIDARLNDGESVLTGALERLVQERDELRVRIHLARLDVRDEWDLLEQKWETLKTRSGGALKQARSAGVEIGAAGQRLLSEIRKGYERIRKAL